MNTPKQNLPTPQTSPTTPAAQSTSQQTQQRAFDPQYTIYKPNNRGSGGVIRFGLSLDKSCVFTEAANQSGERQFDWENKIVMKWGVSDLGNLLALLQGRTAETKLFHRTDKADTSLMVSRQTNNQDHAPYLLSISRKSATDGSLKRVSLPLTHAEAAILQTITTTAINRILQWES